MATDWLNAKCLKSLIYTELLENKTDGKWLRDLQGSVRRTCGDFSIFALEYGAYLESLDIKLAATAKFAADYPNYTTKHQSLKRLVVTLMGDSSTNGIIHLYGKVSPLGWIIAHLKAIGITPLKDRLVKPTLR
jgi:hypothetical protein